MPQPKLEARIRRSHDVAVEVASPSKLTAYYGAMTITGFVGDILKGLPSVRGAIGDVVGTVASGLSGTMTGGTLAIGASVPSSYGAAPVVPAMTTQGRQVAPVTNNYYVTNYNTIDAKNVEDFRRTVEFVDDLPKAFSLVYGAGRGA